MGNTQEELEASVLLGSYNLVAITETWREKSHSWSVAVHGYRMLRRDRLGRSLRECRPPQEERDRVWKAVSEEQLWAGWKHIGKRNKTRDQENLLVDPGKPSEEAFLLQVQEASHSQALVLLETFNHPKIYWKSAQRAISGGDSWNAWRIAS